jgi:hypothetical protein
MVARSRGRLQRSRRPRSFMHGCFAIVRILQSVHPYLPSWPRVLLLLRKRPAPRTVHVLQKRHRRHCLRMRLPSGSMVLPVCASSAAVRRRAHRLAPPLVRCHRHRPVLIAAAEHDQTPTAQRVRVQPAARRNSAVRSRTMSTSTVTRRPCLQQVSTHHHTNRRTAGACRSCPLAPAAAAARLRVPPQARIRSQS